ncbi:hypothetical protein QOZ98_000487 [Planomicrobium stackebrandtii]|uniref:MurNAc-LAA domain-containing protein n=1 Tax=Planomicrobium stackebrandtii TaxID=253160 RepID=A0ABU0GQP1_9BACL|nr:N-acetylmuramoyl-L-alanine amidase [Planomicrobium stackebrandtii]MDQ0427662.1 hypothetical protein [Planomicrobium stackebrandtii]
MAKLLNDKGHGFNTYPPSKGIAAAGGVSGMAEHSFNAAVGDEVERLLKGKLTTYGAQPSNRADVSLATRIANYNAQYQSDHTSIGMSHHGNAGASSVRGFGVFYWHTSANGKKLAQMVLAEYKKEFPGYPIWGTGLFPCVPGTWTDFYLVRETAAPFVLIEWEFFTNHAARKLMLTVDYRKRCGRVAAKAACNWYGIKFEESQPVVAPKPVVKPAAPKPVTKPKEEPKVDKPIPAWKVEYNRQSVLAKKLGFTDGTRPTENTSREESGVIAARVFEAVLKELKE